MNFEMQLFPLGRWKDLDDMAEAAVAAERLGFEAVLIPSHIATPPGPEIEMIGEVWPDNVVIASWLGAQTTTLRIHFAAIVVPYYRPLLVARHIATLDQATGGRVDVTIGAGWFEREFDALQVPYEHRGRITDEFLAAMRTLWTEDRPSYDGEFVSFPEQIFEPKCFQKPHVPIWIGGAGLPARRRVAEYGAGWTMLSGTLKGIGEEIKSMREAVASEGRDPTDLRFGYHFAYRETDPAHDTAASKASDADQAALIGRTPQEAVELLGRCADAGLTHMELTTNWKTSGELIEIMTEFSEEVMPHTQ
jgi:probable F420-dependent oxidoreductase